MIVVYENGELSTDEEIILKADEKKETVTHLKIADDFVDISKLPSLLAEKGDIFYLSQGMTLYIMRIDRNYGITKVFVIEQEVRQNTMKIKNICTSTIFTNDNPLLNYCQFKKADEVGNIKAELEGIFNELEFIPGKEKTYFMTKVEEWATKKDEVFEEKPLEIVKKEPIGKTIKINRRGENNKKQVAYNGVLYESIAKMCETLGIKYNTYYWHLQQGCSHELAVEKSLKTIGNRATRGAMPTKYEYMGTKMSAQELADLSGVPYKTILYRINVRKMSVQEAVETPLDNRGAKRKGE